MFNVDPDYWLAASVEEHRQWGRNDSRFLASLEGDFTARDLWAIAGNYRVARHFPLKGEARPGFEAELRKANLGSSDHMASFDTFVRTTRDLALKASLLGRFRPLSGASKLLWFRFPNVGFIYDNLALGAVCKGGFTAPFYDSLKAWGGPPSDDHEWNFLIFAAGYRMFFRPLHEQIGMALVSVGRDKRRAARVVDKLLWIAGGSDPTRYRDLGRANAEGADRVVAKAACASAKELMQM